MLNRLGKSGFNTNPRTGGSAYCPVQLGHEGTGTIVKLGKNITRDYTGKPLNVGDKIVTGLRPCGVWDTCRNDPEHIHLCPNGEIFGLMPGEDHYFNGWFGEYITMAQKLGAKYTVNIAEDDAAAKVMEITGAGAEMAFQCTGSPKAASAVWKYVRRGGSLCELGFFVNNGDASYNPHLMKGMKIAYVNKHFEQE